MDVLKAREILVDLQVVMFPNTKKGAQNRIHLNLQKKAYPRTFSEQDEEVSTTQQAFNQMRGILGGK